MSGKIMTRLAKASLPRAEKAVLMAIANHVDEAGHGCWASFDTLAQEARYTRRHTIRLINQLEAQGLLVRTGTHPQFGTNVWRIDLDDAPMLPARAKGCQRRPTERSEASAESRRAVAKPREPASKGVAPLNDAHSMRQPVTSRARYAGRTHPNIVPCPDIVDWPHANAWEYVTTWPDVTSVAYVTTSQHALLAGDIWDVAGDIEAWVPVTVASPKQSIREQSSSTESSYADSASGSGISSNKNPETRVNRETPVGMLSTRETPDSIAQNAPADLNANQPEAELDADRCNDAPGQLVGHGAMPDDFALSGTSQALSPINPKPSRTGMVALERDRSLSAPDPRRTGDFALPGTSARIMDKGLPYSHNPPPDPEPGWYAGRRQPGSGHSGNDSAVRSAGNLSDAVEHRIDEEYRSANNLPPAPEPDCLRPACQPGSDLTGGSTTAPKGFAWTIPALLALADNPRLLSSDRAYPSHNGPSVSRTGVGMDDLVEPGQRPLEVIVQAEAEPQAARRPDAEVSTAEQPSAGHPASEALQSKHGPSTQPARSQPQSRPERHQGPGQPSARDAAGRQGTKPGNHNGHSPPPGQNGSERAAGRQEDAEARRRPETDLQRKVTQLCQAKYLTDDMLARLDNTVTASHGDQPSQTFPSPEEEWRARAEWFGEYVELCARRIQEESCQTPSRTKLIQTIRRYDRYKTGWLDFKAAKERAERIILERPWYYRPDLPAWMQ